MFTVSHIIFMVVSIGIPIILACFLPRYNIPLKRILLVSMILGIFSEFLRATYFLEINDGLAHIPRWSLPLHLCSIQIIFMTFMALTKNEETRDKIISFFIPTALWGGVAAIVIPTILSYHEPMHILSINYFLYHGLLIFLSLYLYIVKFKSLNEKSYFQCIKWVSLLFLGSIYVNSLLYEDRANFFFTAGPPMEGLPILNLNNGWVMYIISLVSLGILFITITYIPLFISLRKQKPNQINPTKEIVKKVLIVFLIITPFLLVESLNSSNDEPIMIIGDIPVMSFEVENRNSIDRNIWQDATLTTYNLPEYMNYFIDYPIQIRGRGNSTWAQPKRPFRFRFDPGVEHNVIGLPAARDFVLLTNNHDNTHLRNYLGYNLAREVFGSEYGGGFSPNAVFTIVYLNKEFQGLYLLTEQMQVHENRVDIEVTNDLETEFFLELDYRVRHNQDANFFFTNMGVHINQSVEIRAPANPTQEQVNHIKNIFDNFNNALMSSETIDLEDYINIESFVNFFIIQELFMDIDLNFSSTFMKVDSNGIIHMGPIWDLDLTIGTLHYLQEGDIENGVWDLSRNLFHSRIHGWGEQLINNVQYLESFINRVEELQDILNQSFSEQRMNSILDRIELAVYYDQRRWSENNPTSRHTNRTYWSFRENKIITENSNYNVLVSNLFYGLNMRIIFISTQFEQRLAQIIE